ncbi:prepilin peptidase [Sporosalibacterium faouarense]|uniref:prepilin peptidase n=1 Tax=Sporosalibacterium faouarense TaxID=516123 RepID=UPI00141D3D77|nr:A24 family peptidase [Sporosalibacterium faouarense]MTI47482.1 prepilin peptidase [Bacillota bacterium]
MKEILKGFDKRTSLIYIVLLFINILIVYFKYRVNMGFIRYSFLLGLLAIIAIIDFKKKLIPDYFIILGIIFGIVSMTLCQDISIYNAILGALFPFTILGIISFISKGALGMGDCKLFALIGIFVGFQGAIFILFISSIISGVFSLIMLIARRVTRKTTIPFAPFVYFSTLFVITVCF